MFSKGFFAALVFIGASGVSAFAPNAQTPQSSSSALNMIGEDGAKKAAGSFLAASFLLSNVAFAAPVMAAMDDAMDFGSSQVIAGRSGGRAGGRSSAARAPPRSSAPSRSSNTRVVERTTVIRQPSYAAPSVIVAPPVYGGYGYNPLPGVGEFLFA